MSLFQTWLHSERLGIFKAAAEDAMIVASKTPGILALAINGSRAGEDFDQQRSDIDLVCIAENQGAIDRMKEAYGRRYELDAAHMLFLSKEIEYFTFGATGSNHRSLAIDLKFFTLREYQERVAVVDKGPEALLEVQDWLRHKVLQTIPLYDPSNIIGKAKETIQALDEETRAEMAWKANLRLMHSCGYFHQRPKFPNPLTASSDIMIFFDALLAAHYANNSTFYMKGFKHIAHDLQSMKPDIGDVVAQLSNILPSDIEKHLPCFVSLAGDVIEHGHRAWGKFWDQKASDQLLKMAEFYLCAATGNHPDTPVWSMGLRFGIRAAKL